MKRAITLALIFLSASCAHTPSPPDAVPGRIAVVADTKSPYWKSWINHYVPKGVNDYAHYQIVDGSRDAPYKLVIRVVNADSYISEFSTDRYGAEVNYRTRVEVEAVFLDENSRSVWSWSGWADFSSGEKSMKKIAKMLGEAMSKGGLLVPSYYTSASPTKTNTKADW